MALEMSIFHNLYNSESSEIIYLPNWDTENASLPQKRRF